MRFTLIDKILELTPGKSITGVKNLSLAEEYLQDHFPGFPVLPGVLMIEALVQAGAWLMRHDDNFQHSTILLKQARGVKFSNFVSPGNALIVKVDMKSQEGNTWTLQGAGTVNGASAVSAKLTLERFNLADQNPDLKGSDEYQIRKARELFGELYRPTASSVATP